MSDAAPPVPTPPSIGREVAAYAETEALRDAVNAVLDLTLKTRTDVERLANEATKHGLAQTSLERRVTAVEGKVDTLLRYTMALAKQFGVKLDG